MYALIAVLLIGGVESHQAAQPKLSFEYVELSEGIGPQIRPIAQDASGFIWLGTADGLVRYDGVRQRVFRHNPDDPATLSDNLIQTLYVARDGVLWIGGSRGLNRYDPRSETFIRYSHNDKKDMRGYGAVRSIHEDPSGGFWIGTVMEGLKKLDRETGEFTEVGDFRGHNIARIYEDKAGTLWLSSAVTGLVKFDPKTETAIVYRHDGRDPSSLGADSVSGVVEGRDGKMWVSTYGAGLNELDLETGKFRRVPGRVTWIDAILRDDDGRLWVGTEGDGLFRFDPATDMFTWYQLPADEYAARSLFFDEGGVLWIGTIGGFYRVARASARSEHYRHEPGNPNSLTAGYVRGIYEDRDGAVWMANSDGLDRFNRAEAEIRRFKPDDEDPALLFRNDLYQVVEDKFGDLWLGSSSTGPKRFNPKTFAVEQFRHDPNRPSSLSGNWCAVFVDLDKEVWAVCSGLDREDSDLYEFDYVRSRFIHHTAVHEEFSKMRVQGAFMLSNGWMLFGSQHGSWFYRPNESKMVQIEGLPEGGPSAAFESHGYLWLASHGGWLCRVKPETGEIKKYRPLTPTDGEDQHHKAGIHAGVADGDHLWMATSAGLLRMDVPSETFTPYGSHDGLMRSYDAAHRGASGTLYFAGKWGLTVFGGVAAQHDVAPSIVITGATVLHEPVSLPSVRDYTPRVDVPFRSSAMSIEFAALSYTSPESNRFQYKLEGLSDDWVDTPQPSVSFGNLPPGTYTFLVRGATNRSGWSAKPAELTVHVEPPPWKTWWAYTGYILIVGGMLLGFVRYREQHLERRELERRVAAAVREVRETEEALIRTSQLARFGEFAATVAHDLKTPLTFIRGELELLEECHLNGKCDDAMLSETITALLEHTRRMRSEIETAMNYVRPSDGNASRVDLRGLLNEVVTMLRVRARQSRVELRTGTVGEPTVSGDRDSLRHVIANLVVNAIETMPRGGLVELVATANGGDVEIRVTDTGPGVAEGVREKLFQPFVSTKGERGTGLGLASSKRIIEEDHRGEIRLESTGDAGSTFLIRLPPPA